MDDFDLGINMGNKSENIVQEIPVKKTKPKNQIAKNFMLKPGPQLSKYLQKYCDITGIDAQSVIKTAIFEHCSALTGKIE